VACVPGDAIRLVWLARSLTGRGRDVVPEPVHVERRRQTTDERDWLLGGVWEGGCGVVRGAGLFVQRRDMQVGGGGGKEGD
jgi:hypothetical protein